MKLDNLDSLRQAEETNYQASLERLGDTVTLAEDFSEAYEAISRLLRETKDPADHLYVVNVLFLAARYQLDKAVLDILRARISDGIQATRRAAELATFAAKIDRHPHLADVWLEASRGESEYETYRSKFSRDLFPREDELLNRLHSRYDQGSKQFHGSPYSVGSRASVESSPGKVEFEFKTFEIDNEELAEPASGFLWVLDTHFGILQIFVRVLQSQMGTKLIAWDVRKNAIEAKLDAHRVKWEPIIRARIARNSQKDAGDDPAGAV